MATHDTDTITDLREIVIRTTIATRESTRDDGTEYVVNGHAFPSLIAAESYARHEREGMIQEAIDAIEELAP